MGDRCYFTVLCSLQDVPLVTRIFRSPEDEYHEPSGPVTLSFNHVNWGGIREIESLIKATPHLHAPITYHHDAGEEYGPTCGAIYEDSHVWFPATKEGEPVVRLQIAMGGGQALEKIGARYRQYVALCDLLRERAASPVPSPGQ